MLQAIRGQAGSWVVKILFVFLILSFAAWGIGDIFTGGGGPDQVAAEVGDVEISVAEVDRTLRRDVEQMRQVFGPEFTVEQAASMGFVDRAVETLVTGALLDQMAADHGILPPTDAVAAQIRQQPVFQDESGQFSRDLFLNLLARSGLTEQGYVAMLRRDLARERVAGAVSAGAGAPDILADSLYRYRQERRTAETIAVGPGLITELPEPTEADLKAFHEAHGERFSLPEYRRLTVVTLNPDEMAEGIAIAEDELRAEYEARLDEYERPETRRFDQIVVEDEATARAIAEAAKDGGSLAEAAEAEGVASPVIPLDWAAKDAMLPQLGEAGFALPEGGVSDPVQSPFGWHVLKLTGVRPAGTVPFEEARPELEKELKRDRALDRVFEVANEFEDALAGGTALDEAADQLGLTAVTVGPVAQDGSLREGAGATDLEALDAVLGTAFALAEGGTSGLEDTPDGFYYAVRVDEVIEPAVRPLPEVRDRVAEAWTEEQRAKAVEALAADLAERLRNGEDPKAVAADAGAEYGETPALLRDGSNRGQLPPALVGQLFGMNAGDVAVVADGDRQVVFQLAEVTPADPPEEGEVLASIDAEVEAGMAQDLVAQFTRALRDRYEVDIHREALDQLYGPD